MGKIKINPNLEFHCKAPKHQSEDLKVSREKIQATYKGTIIRLSIDFSTASVEKEDKNNTFEVLKVNCGQPLILYKSRPLLMSQTEIKTISSKLSHRVFTNRHLLKNSIKNGLYKEELLTQING